MNLQTKIEEEIKKLETTLEQNHIYIEIKRLEKELSYRKEDLENNSTYQTLQTLKNILSEASAREEVDNCLPGNYKILNKGGYKRPGIKHLIQNKLEDTSHYPEMLDFLEAHMDLDPHPIPITRLYNIALDAGYKCGGKRPAYTLSAGLSRDERFTPTNKGWVLTKDVQTSNT